MAIFDRLKLKKRQGILAQPQPNSYVDSLGRVSRYYNTVYAGTFVDEATTLSIPGLWRGITLISDTIGALPIHAYRGDVRIEPIPPILERPYPKETRIETLCAMTAALLIHGNYIAILGEIGANVGEIYNRLGDINTGGHLDQIDHQQELAGEHG